MHVELPDSLRGLLAKTPADELAPLWVASHWLGIILARSESFIKPADYQALVDHLERFENEVARIRDNN